MKETKKMADRNVGDWTWHCAEPGCEGLKFSTQTALLEHGAQHDKHKVDSLFDTFVSQLPQPPVLEWSCAEGHEREMFPSLESYDKHRQVWHSTIDIRPGEYWECAQCNKPIGSRQELYRHQREAHNYTEGGGARIISYRSDQNNPRPTPVQAAEVEVNLMPAGQGKRDVRRRRHDCIPVEFLDALAEIFEEGLRPRPGLPEGYGDSWKKGGKEFLRDCLNHASNHLHRAMNGDKSEANLAKTAWNVLVVDYFERKEQAEK